MQLAQPNETPYDLRFSIFGFPVRIHPFFWLAALILGVGNGSDIDGVNVIIWTSVLFLSILVHELGHAFAFRYFGTESSIVLYAFGGLAIPDGGGSRNVWKSHTSFGRERVPQNHILISLAGPFAGFGLALLTLVVLLLLQGEIVWLEGPLGIPYFFAALPPLRYSDHLNYAVNNLLMLNIYWGLLNLLPIFPLDGGQVSRELFMISNPHDGLVRSINLSMVAAIVMSIVSLVLFHQMMMVILFASLAYSSYQVLQQIRGPRGPW